nr:MAG TPA: hypothetical protein [Caudoviricetes sp.]DAN97270.1 MAG TPA: hypothetical protein [Caudoviricetes sp.]DAW45420.1 MAG TPA: hypothetical protein [Bacteriophage sp.]
MQYAAFLRQESNLIIKFQVLIFCKLLKINKKTLVSLPTN